MDRLAAALRRTRDVAIRGLVRSDDPLACVLDEGRDRRACLRPFRADSLRPQMILGGQGRRRRLRLAVHRGVCSLQERSGTGRLALQRLIAAQPVMPAHDPFLSRAQAVRAWRNLHQSYWNLIVGKAATSTTANASLVYLITGCGPKPEGGRLLLFKEPLRPVQSPPRLRRVVKTS